ncbi:MAG TPA: bifunctional 3-phenylpropionate/cinnamic acid dioxygenase ferredoxin subunit [Candidatus Binataceae bacterium]|nr:bifunctional 3-phenylpropionate/cinnamic acid dioxygenase ferredoxin subunit [Candidatus Binataceae bacterium]
MAWTRVCRADEIANEAALKIARPNPIAIFHVGGEFFAIDDTCTHAKFSLADGYVEGAEVVCALHEARFCLRTGNVLSPPAAVGLRTYPVRVEGGEVFVDLE